MEQHEQRVIDQQTAEIGRRIHQARTDAGITLAALGGKELSRSFLSLVEHGKSRMSIRSLQLVADRLGLPIESLLGTPVKGDAVIIQRRQLRRLGRQILAFRKALDELEDELNRLAVLVPHDE